MLQFKTDIPSTDLKAGTLYISAIDWQALAFWTLAVREERQALLRRFRSSARRVSWK
jgi:hypothetical protein